MTAAPDPSRYLTAAERVGDWLAGCALEQPEGGVAWPPKPELSDEVHPSLGWGSLGPLVFYADASRVGGSARALEWARAGGRWLSRALGSPDPDAAPGLFTGWAGAAVAFNELARAGLDVEADLVRVLDLLKAGAVGSDTGVHWRETTEVMWGTAGIGFVLLAIGAPVTGDEATTLAVRAGDWLLSVAHPVPEGIRWDLGPGPVRDRPRLADLWFPNFAHGTAGVAAFLARLGAAANDQRFVDAARSGASWVLSTCRFDDGGCAARHHDPLARPGDTGNGPARAAGDTSPQYSMGWCHGPPGLGWSFREMQLATGDDGWAELVARTATSVRRSGIPERREPGFWDNVGRCCGSAGVAEYFLDLHTWRRDPADLAFAVALVDDLLDRAVVDGAGMRWSNVELRADPPELTPETTQLQGASGIGQTLLRLGRHLGGETSTVEWPHAPRWTGADSGG